MRLWLWNNSLDARDSDDIPEEIRERTHGRGTDSVVDAVGMEAHGTESAAIAQKSSESSRIEWPRQ
jgi:threonine dehydrogenase-like Zn-dependent dehydrogenase